MQISTVGASKGQRKPEGFRAQEINEFIGNSSSLCMICNANRCPVIGSEDELNTLRARVINLEKALKSLSAMRLTPKKKLILSEAIKLSGRKTFTSAVGAISRNLAIPYSTVKWNMMKLRSCGLINAGSKERQSIPIAVTEAGAIAMALAEQPAAARPFTP